jgi:3-hydroxyacyl-[acyl-carrier-protein] dehydratase
MKEIWHSISYNKGIAQGSTVWADAYIGAASPWFSGHFPDEPILPGIAILSMVSEVIRQVASERGGEIRISAIRRVRFRIPVRPDNSLSISLSSTDGDDHHSYHFKVTINGDTACTGIIDAEPLPEKS